MAVPCELLLYPELLSTEQLLCIIQERQLRVENIDRMSRDELVDLFRNFCVPYGQRKYRDTGRGKMLNRNRNSSPEESTKLNVINHNHCTREVHLKRDRLKPPPELREMLSGQMKRIKLDSNVNGNTVNNIKRKMSIDSPPAEVSPPKKERKLITWP